MSDELSYTTFTQVGDEEQITFTLENTDGVPWTKLLSGFVRFLSAVGYGGVEERIAIKDDGFLLTGEWAGLTFDDVELSSKVCKDESIFNTEDDDYDERLDGL